MSFSRLIVLHEDIDRRVRTAEERPDGRRSRSDDEIYARKCEDHDEGEETEAATVP